VIGANNRYYCLGDVFYIFCVFARITIYLYHTVVYELDFCMSEALSVLRENHFELSVTPTVCACDGRALGINLIRIRSV
jgi:hypothetical protein